MSGEPSVHGAAVIQARTALENLVGPVIFREAMSALSAADRDHYLGALPVSWVPVRVVNAVLNELSKRDGRSPVQLGVQSSRSGLENNLRTVWKLLMRVTTDEMLVSRSPTFYGKTYDRGTLSAKLVKPGLVEATLTGWPGIPDIQTAIVAAGIETTLRVAGRQGVKTTHARNRDGATFTATWHVSA
jgi:hypothetical protein